MKITIGIPCYKQAEYLPEAIESALNQTYQDIEVIVVDDGSPDNTSEVAKRYPVKLVRQVNKGLSSARNTAIMNMTGGYFLPLDADDILYDTCVEKIVQRIKETNADIVAPSMKCFGKGESTVILKPRPTVSDFRVGNHIGYFSAIRKGLLLECGGYSPRMVWGYEDYHIWFDLLSRGATLEVIQEPLVLYRTKEYSMWHEAKEHHKELMEQIYKDFPQIWPK